MHDKMGSLSETYELYKVPIGNAKMKNKISGKKEFISLAEEQAKHKKGKKSE